jgi:hypothetical protein
MLRSKLIKVTFDLAEQKREGDITRYLFDEPRSGKIYNVIRKSFKMASMLYPPKWAYLGWKALEVPEKVAIRFLIANNGSG